MRTGLVLLTAALLLSACESADEPPVVVANVEITAPRPGSGMSAGYLEIRNNTREHLAITRVESPQFGKVALHESTIEDGVARMRPLEAVEIAPGEVAVLEPGGKHLMLMAPVQQADQVTLNLYSGDLLVVSVEAPAGQER